MYTLLDDASTPAANSDQILNKLLSRQYCLHIDNSILGK